MNDLKSFCRDIILGCSFRLLASVFLNLLDDVALVYHHKSVSIDGVLKEEGFYQAFFVGLIKEEVGRDLQLEDVGEIRDVHFSLANLVR